MGILSLTDRVLRTRNLKKAANLEVTETIHGILNRRVPMSLSKLVKRKNVNLPSNLWPNAKRSRLLKRKNPQRKNVKFLTPMSLRKMTQKIPTLKRKIARNDMQLKVK